MQHRPSAHPSFRLFRYLTRGSCSLIVCVAANASAAELHTDVVYAHAGDVELQLDYARPDSDELVPAIVLIHGGGWKQGHRSAYRGRVRKAVDRGYFAATISHRLTSETDDDGEPLYPWPAAINDCKAAVRYLRSNADRYMIDPDRIAACGASSGGHLALMLALTDDSDGLDGDVTHVGATAGEPVSSQVAAAISLSGPTEMATCYYAPVVRPFAESLLSGSPIDNPTGYASASPIHFLSASDPPIMMAHGEEDAVVPVEQSQFLAAESERLGRTGDRLLVLPGQPHVFRRDTGPKVWDAAYEFLAECWSRAGSKDSDSAK